jgi:hypothetical protein
VNAPTPLQYLLFSDLAYDLTPSGSFNSIAAAFSFSNLPPSVIADLDGFTLGPTTTSAAGVTAVTFVDNNPATLDYKDVVIAYRGTVTLFDYLSDAQLAFGKKPSQFDAAVDFALQDETASPYPSSSGYSYFVTGHSLGGAEAEDVAAVLGLGGDTFGAPGVSKILTAGGVLSNGANLTDYVIAGDPIGNYTALSGRHVGTEVSLPSVPNTSGFFGQHDIDTYGQALVNDHLISSNPLPI